MSQIKKHKPTGVKKINFAKRITIRIDVKDVDYLLQNTDNISEFIRESIKTAIEQRKSLKTR